MTNAFFRSFRILNSLSKEIPFRRDFIKGNKYFKLVKKQPGGMVEDFEG